MRRFLIIAGVIVLIAIIVILVADDDPHPIGGAFRLIGQLLKAL